MQGNYETNDLLCADPLRNFTLQYSWSRKNNFKANVIPVVPAVSMSRAYKVYEGSKKGKALPFESLYCHNERDLTTQRNL